MIRVIRVKVVDRNGYGKSGYKVKVYGGQEVKTDREGTAVVEAKNSSVAIYVEGATAYDGYTSSCPNPLIVTRG